jgi:hypothetical protein
VLITMATKEFRTVTSQIITDLHKISLNPPPCTCHSHTHSSDLPAMGPRPGGTMSQPRAAVQVSGSAVAVPPAQISPPEQPSSREDSPTVQSVRLSQRVVIIPGVFIPDLKKGNEAWLDAVHQWEDGDPANGLQALRDWPRKWYTEGTRQVTGAKRSQRKMIFEEYERCVVLWLNSLNVKALTLGQVELRQGRIHQNIPRGSQTDQQAYCGHPRQ